MTVLKESELHQKLNDLLDRVWSAAEKELDTPVTSIGLHLYGHGGEVNILLNTDDDKSFQVEAIGDFKSRKWGEIIIPELEEWVIEGVEFEFERVDGARVDGGIEAYKSTFSSLVDATKHYISTVADGVWRPNFFVYEDSPVLMDVGFWECPEGILLPPQSPASQAPLVLNGFREGTPDGLKVYSIGFTERKYCGLYLSREGPQLPVRNGSPILKEWPTGVKAHAWASHKRKGELARVDKASFAIKRESSEELREWLRPFAEFLPLEDENDQGWDIIHVLGDAVGPPSKNRGLRGKPAPELTRDEWLQLECPIFRGSDGRDQLIYVIAGGDNNETDFFDLVKKYNLRGVQFDLVWCEDTSFLRDRLRAASEQIQDKAEKYSGSRELTSRYSEYWTERDFDIHQLYQDLKDHTDLKGMEGFLSVNLWHFYNV